jgi:tetratricopeptide (TPR) repeat protein
VRPHVPLPAFAGPPIELVQPLPPRTPPPRPVAPPRLRRPGDGGPPPLASYEQALGLLGRQRWRQAAELFEALAERSDEPEIAGRARVYLDVCRRRMAEEQQPSDPYLQAVVEKNRGNYEEALRLLAGLDRADERNAYLEASIHAVTGRFAEAEEALRRAVELEPKNRIHAFHDPDFAELRARTQHTSLFGLG